MWYSLGDGSYVDSVPDGWRVRNPDNSYHHIKDVGHTWAAATEALTRGRNNAVRGDTLFATDPEGWVCSTEVAERAKGLGLHHIELGKLLRRHGGTPQKHGGVRGWRGVALCDPSAH